MISEQGAFSKVSFKGGKVDAEAKQQYYNTCIKGNVYIYSVGSRYLSDDTTEL